MALETNPHEDTSIPDCNGNTPVHLSAEVGHLQIMKRLGQNVTDLDQRNVHDETPLHSVIV